MIYKKLAGIGIAVTFVTCLVSARQAIGAEPAPVPLNLGSSSRSLSAAGALRGSGSAAINVGGSLRVVGAQDKVTPAEFAALQQALQGHQTLTLDATGRAVAGLLNFGTLGQTQLSSLTVPKGVTAFGGTQDNTLNVLGAVQNLGTIAGITPARNVVFNLLAETLTNRPGALITTFTPDSLRGVLPESSAPIDLNIVLTGNLVNGGTISASGNLNLTLGGDVFNSGGTLAAPNGALNIVSTAPKANGFTITGGVLSSLNNTVTANGVLTMQVAEIAGRININAGESHVTVSGGDLKLGAIKLTGDPTFVNLNGDVTIAPNIGTSLLFSGQDVAILASGSVLADPSLTAIDLSSTTGKGGSLFISAGLIPKLVAAATERYSLGKPSTTGGSVILPNVILNTSSTVGDAGDITVSARDNDLINQPGGAGRIQLNVVGATAPAGKGGDITIVAQAGPLNLDQPVAAFGTNGGGAIGIYGGAPVSKSLVFTRGKQTSGTLAIDSDLNHEPVAVTVAPAVGYIIAGASDGQYSKEFRIDTQGPLNLGDGLAILSDQVFLRSRTDVVTDAGQFLVAGNKGVDIQSFGAGDSSFGPASNFQSQNGPIALQNYGGSLSLGANSQVTSFKDTSYLFAMTDINFGNAVDITSLNGNFLAGGGNLNLGNNGSLFAIGSNIVASGGDINIGTGKNITSGLLTVDGQTKTGVLDYDDFSMFGGTYLLAEKNITLHSSVRSAGLDIAGVARTGTMDLGSGNTFDSAGGNVAFFAQGALSGSNNVFRSRAVGDSDSFDGGVIELSSGFTFNPFVLAEVTPDSSNEAKSLRGDIIGEAKSIALFKRTSYLPFTAPDRDAFNVVLDTSLMGPNVSIDNNGIDVGLMKVTKLSGNIDLTNSKMFMNKGAIFIESIGAGASVSMPGSTFTTHSLGVLPDSFTSENLVKLVTDVIDGVIEYSNLPLDTGDSVDFLNTNLVSARPRPDLVRGLLGTRRGHDKEEDKAESQASFLARLAAQGHNAFGYRGQIIDTGRTETTRMNFALNNVQNFANTQAMNVTNGGGVSIPVRVSEGRSDLMLFTTAGQVMTNVGGQGEVIGGRGTVVSGQGDKVVLHVGQVYANSGDQPMEIATDFGSIEVDKDSSVAITSEPGQPSRVVALGGKGSDGKIIVKPRSGQAAQFTLQPGEQATIEMQRDGGDQQARAVIMTGKIDVPKLVERESFYSASGLRLGGTARSAYQRLLDNLATSGDTFIHRSTPGFAFEIKGAEVPSRVLAEDGTVFQQNNDGSLDVKYGALMLHSDAEQKVKTALGDVKVEPTGTVAVETTDRLTRIRSFTSNGAKISVDGQTISLNAGEEFFVQASKPTKHEALPKDGIARRQLKHLPVGKGKHGVFGEFSIYTALSTGPALRPLRHPSNSRDRQLNSSILKAAVALDMATGARGRYFVTPPDEHEQ